MVCPDSHRIPRVPWYLGAPPGGRSPFAYRALTFYGQLFQDCSARRRLGNSSALRQQSARVPRPRDGNACRLSRRLGLASPLFARHYSGDDIFSCGYLDVSVLRVPSTRSIYSTGSTWTFLQVGCPIRKSPDRVLASSYPRLIATTLRPSSALGAKASTVCPW